MRRIHSSVVAALGRWILPTYGSMELTFVYSCHDPLQQRYDSLICRNVGPVVDWPGVIFEVAYTRSCGSVAAVKMSMKTEVFEVCESELVDLLKLPDDV